MRSTTLMVMAVMIGLAALLPQASTAQQEESSAKSSAEREYRGPLPSYFGKLGLSEPQKIKLYQIQDSYEGQIAKLRKQIEELEELRDNALETQLTPGQKLRLKELREEARLNQESSETAEAAAAKETKPN